MTYELWEEMVQERSQLMDVSNDIKMIGKESYYYFLPLIIHLQNDSWPLHMKLGRAKQGNPTDMNVLMLGCEA